MIHTGLMGKILLCRSLCNEVNIDFSITEENLSFGLPLIEEGQINF